MNAPSTRHCCCRLMDEAETAELGVSDSTTALPAHTTEGVGPESQPLPPDVMWGPLVFEARRFVELRKKSFKGGECSLAVGKR